MTLAHKESFIRRGLYLLLLLLGMIPVGGCSGVVERSWSEDVALDDGRVIVIERYAKFSESNALGGGAYSSTDLESKVSFRDELSSLPSWSVPLVPIVLYQDSTSHEWVIVATTDNCDTWYERGSPVPPYWEYRLKGGKWSQTKLSTSSIGRATNLFFDYGPSLPARRISVEIKNHWLSTHNFAKDFLGIGADIKVNCMQR